MNQKTAKAIRRVARYARQQTGKNLAGFPRKLKRLYRNGNTDIRRLVSREKRLMEVGL